MKNSIALLVGMGLFAVLLCIGCGGQKLPADLPELFPAVLTVIQDGKPLPGALITLTNVEEGVKWGCVARTNAEGKATMKTNGLYEGAPAGTYKATVIKQEHEETPDPYAGAPDPSDQTAYQEWGMANQARITAMQRTPSVSYNLVSPEFREMETTPLEITVSEDKSEHTLDVGKAIRVVSRERSR